MHALIFFIIGRRGKTIEKKPAAPAYDASTESGKKGGQVNQAAADAAVVLRAREEIFKRAAAHIQSVIFSAQATIQFKVHLLIKTAEFLSGVCGEVSTHLSKVASINAQTAAGDVAAALKIQQDVLIRIAERVKAASHDKAMAIRAKQDTLKAVAQELVKVSGEIAGSMSAMARVAAGTAQLLIPLLLKIPWFT